MTPKLGFVLPTREAVMRGRMEAGPMLDLAARADALGFDSVWLGDSLFARARFEPLTLLAAIAVRAPRLTLGTAVLLPALRNPVGLAHQLATIDRLCEGRLVIGFGIGPATEGVRAEYAAVGVPFETRMGATLEALRLCKALWTGEPVDWDGRWTLSGAVLGPTPHRPGGPPILIGGGSPRVRERAGRIFDGWLPVSSDAAQWRAHWAEIADHARAAGRDPAALTGAVCLNLSIGEDAAEASRRLDAYLAEYYGVADPAPLRRSHGSYAGPAAGAADWLKGFADAGVSHFALRFAGDNERHLETVADIRARLGW